MFDTASDRGPSGQTSRLRLVFEGHVQLRMATDPDPSTDARGLSGYTFALPGEPDFDGVLHFQPDEPGVFERDCGGHAFSPRVGVRIRRVIRNGREEPASPLVGGRFSLLGAELVEHNGLVTRNDVFALDPVHVRVEDAAGRLVIERRDELVPGEPSFCIFDADSGVLERRQRRSVEPFSEEVLRVMLSDDYRRELERAAADEPGKPASIEARLLQIRRDRYLHLRALKDTRPDDQGLETRLQELLITNHFWDLPNDEHSNPAALDRRVATLGLRMGWGVDVNGKCSANTLGADPARTWPLAFWIGGWDADTLCAYVSGHWDVAI